MVRVDPRGAMGLQSKKWSLLLLCLILWAHGSRCVWIYYQHEAQEHLTQLGERLEQLSRKRTGLTLLDALVILNMAMSELTGPDAMELVLNNQDQLIRANTRPSWGRLIAMARQRLLEILEQDPGNVSHEEEDSLQEGPEGKIHSWKGIGSIRMKRRLPSLGRLWK